MRDLPHLTYLQAFEAAARHLSFTRAAEELNCTQAAISQRVRALEQYFGRPLFQRKPNGLELSQAGKAYLPGVSQSLDLMEASTRGLTGRGPRQSVTVSAPISFLNLWLAPRTPAFLSDHPEIGLRMNSAIWTDPNLELADLSIAIVEHAAMPSGARPLASAPLVLVAPGAAVQDANADVLPRIEVQGRYKLWDLWCTATGESTGKGSSQILVDTSITALDLVAAGAGRAVVYEPYTAGLRDRGRPDLTMHTSAEVGHVLVLHVNPDRRPNAGVRAFIDWISGHFPGVEG